MVAEKRPGFIHARLVDQPSDARAGDHEILVADRVDLLGVEPVADTERSQQRKCARAIAPEQKVRADPDLGHVQPVDEHRRERRSRDPIATAQA